MCGYQPTTLIKLELVVKSELMLAKCLSVEVAGARLSLSTSNTNLFRLASYVCIRLEVVQAPL